MNIAKQSNQHPEHRGRLIATVVLIVAFIGMLGFTARSALVRASNVVIDATTLHLEIADTDATRTQGLSDRASLDVDAGMLFIFPSRGILPFWMKDMHFPLDMIWIDGDRVVEVVTLPPPSSSTIVPATHTPLHVADKVLEINAGQAKEMGLKPGVKILLSQ